MLGGAAQRGRREIKKMEAGGSVRENVCGGYEREEESSERKAVGWENCPLRGRWGVSERTHAWTC